LIFYLLKIHVITYITLIIWNNVETCRNHSKYDPHHFKHHAQLSCNFGPSPFLDIIMKTYRR
jgi:hypothetical protein